MSCGAFGGLGSCGGGGGGGSGVGSGGPQGPRQIVNKQFFDPFCLPPNNKQCEPSYYFNPFVHAQCLGVNMNMENFRQDIRKCQEDYKKAVWGVLRKYAVGDGGAAKGNNSNSNNARRGGWRSAGNMNNKSFANCNRSLNANNANNVMFSSPRNFPHPGGCYPGPSNSCGHNFSLDSPFGGPPAAGATAMTSNCPDDVDFLLDSPGGGLFHRGPGHCMPPRGGSMMPMPFPCMPEVGRR